MASMARIDPHVKSVVTCILARLHPWHVVLVEQDAKALQDYTKWCESILAPAVSSDHHADILIRLMERYGKDDDPVFHIFVFLATLALKQHRVESELAQHVDPDTHLPREIDFEMLQQWIASTVPLVRSYLQGLSQPVAFPEQSKDGSEILVYKMRSEMCADDNDRVVGDRTYSSKSGCVPFEIIAADKYNQLCVFVRTICYDYMMRVDTLDVGDGALLLAGRVLDSPRIMQMFDQIFKERAVHLQTERPVVLPDEVAIRILREHHDWKKEQLEIEGRRLAALYT